MPIKRTTLSFETIRMAFRLTSVAVSISRPKDGLSIIQSSSKHRRIMSIFVVSLKSNTNILLKKAKSALKVGISAIDIPSSNCYTQLYKPHCPG